MWPDTSHVCKLSTVNMADSSSSEGSWKVKIMIGLMSLFGKSGPGALKRQDKPKIEYKSQKRIKSPYIAAVLMRKEKNSECITLVNKVPENQSLIEYSNNQVKKTKCADSWIPWKQSVSVLHAHTFQSLFFTDCEKQTYTLVEVHWMDSFSRVVFHNIHVSTHL